MKRNFEIINNHNTADAVMSMQDEDARKLLASRERLLALNAVFDAALAGEPARHIAKGIHRASHDGGECLIQHLLNEESTTEH